MHLNAPTFNYCEQDLDDSPSPNGGTWLETENGTIRTFNLPDFLNPLLPANYNQQFIPTINGNEWDNTFRQDVYQAHFSVSNIVPLFNELINDAPNEFMNVNVGVTNDNNFPGAGAAANTLPQNTTISLGYAKPDQQGFMGLNDVIAHELGHVYVNNFLAYDVLGAQSLHEGVSDMFGVYFESLIQNNEGISCTEDGLDWVMGDDVTEVEELADRDLENPDITTWQQAQVTFQRHERSVVLSHWFYLISQGAPGVHNGPNYQPTIPRLGIEGAINIVMEALPLLQTRNDDYPDFMEAVIMAVDMNWGLCSKESAAVRRAFTRIGMGDGETCAYVHIKPRYCESGSGMILCIEEGFSDDAYRWTFPSEWTVQGAGANNTYIGHCLKVTDWSEYSSYPRNLTVRLRNMDSNRNVDYNIRLEDCEGDDPACNDVASNAVPPSASISSSNLNATAQEKSENIIDTEVSKFVRVYDINGRMIYGGQNFDKEFKDSNSNSLLIYCYYNKQGRIIKTEKVIILK